MKWYRSLYWRIAAGFVACLALLLTVQAILFVWVISRSGRTIPNQPAERLAPTIALDASQALERDPTTDLERYLRQEYGHDAQPFFVQLKSGQTIEIGGPFPDTIVQDARVLAGLLARGGPGGPGRGRGPGQSFGRGGPFRPFRPAPILVNGSVLGLVVVPPQPPFTFLLARYAPVLGLVAVGTLLAGAVLATVLIFGPARKRLRALEEAARRFGAGDLSVRAPASGRDEVAAVASAFNAMAVDLSERAKALAVSDRARRQLLADVSHELTTPVTAMRGYIETLTIPELRLDETTRARYLGIIGDETARLEHIIGDLLDLARLEGGGGSLVLEDVSVVQLFDRVRARHERALTDAGVALATTVAPRASFVRGDRDRLEQALQNLTANALRYAPSGTSIVLAADTTEFGVRFTVEDAGAGIALEHLPHVFDRFYKVDASRAIRQGPGAAGGSGLGLSIVKAIVERHAGTVTVRSQPGSTVFQFTLPL